MSDPDVYIAVAEDIESHIKDTLVAYNEEAFESGMMVGDWVLVASTFGADGSHTLRILQPPAMPEYRRRGLLDHALRK